MHGVLCMILVWMFFSFECGNSAAPKLTTYAPMTPVTTVQLQELHDMFKYSRDIINITISYDRLYDDEQYKYLGIFGLPMYPDENGEWYIYFGLKDEEGAKYEVPISIAQYSDLIELIIENEVCEMQPMLGGNLDRSQDHAIIGILCTGESNIGYNTRTPESEPFWEVVDYIEENFVEPSLQNPVDKWWREP